ncbi:helix-turn-helix domain-containing protein [Rhodococcus sp. SJ-2]
MRKSLNPNMMTMGEVAEALDMTRGSIKKYRRHKLHPFFGKAFQIGTAPNSPLYWDRADVDAFLDERRNSPAVSA